MDVNAQPPEGTPPAEFAIDAALVSGLIADQHPDLASLPLRPVDAGWDNAMYRLGDALAVRLPRRALGAQLIVHEQTWLPHLARRLTLPAPAPVRAGVPGRGYPWPWSIVPWLPGTSADLSEPDPSQAERFGAFLRSLHRPAPADAPHNPYRGVPLRDRAPMIESRMQRLSGRTTLLTPEILAIWRDALAAPVDAPRTWLHGDLHARNVLVEDGSISGVVDWGDITAGDGATDLASLWMLFDAPSARAAAWAAYGAVSSATRARARGWAVFFGVALLDTGLVDHPGHAAIGERTLRRVAVS
jgi:aminoglycoside phosphotransferase (APT) family kinase protein